VAAAIKVMGAGAVESMVAVLGREFERDSGNRLTFVFNTAGALRERILGGETADLVILSQSAIASLDKSGMFVPGSVTDLGRTVTGVAVRAGTAAPDISTPQAFKQALLAVRGVAYVDPQAGGSSGIFFAGLLERLGIADAVNAKALLGKRGFEVAQAVADGRADIGITFISEMLTVPGATVVGPLPGELHNVNTYTAAIPAGGASVDAAMALLRALTDPASAARWNAAGLEPAFAMR
jgi:molybdate transport system substrate-binding protein